MNYVLGWKEIGGGKWKEKLNCSNGMIDNWLKYKGNAKKDVWKSNRREKRENRRLVLLPYVF